MLTVEEAMRRALELAVSPDAPRGVNPRVGCVLIDADGALLASGHHRGAGTPHAEVDALARAGSSARGATAVVTLEPCRHTGRTGPCTQALIEAGVSRVVYAQSDPTERAAGGAQVLRAAGIDVVGGVLAAEAEAVNRAWTHVQRMHRPLVTIKTAVSLDGRVADAGGGPTALTGAEARAFVHALRAEVDAVIVGTATAVVDDPQLTVRDAPVGINGQPLRVVMGERDLPPGLRVLDASAPSLQVRTHDPVAVLDALLARGVNHVLVEGGPTVTAAFLEADLVDDVVWLVAPTLLGAGPVSLPPLPSGPRHVVVRDVRTIGDDVAVIGSLSERES